MIVVDIETSGSHADEAGCWQIGGVDLETGEEFLEEARIDDEDKVDEAALKIGGKTEEELRDKNKQSQKQMIQHFFEWFKKRKFKNFLSQAPQVLDFPLIRIKAKKYRLKLPYHYRTFDLHSIAQLRYFQINGKFLVKKDEEFGGISSDMGLRNCVEFCGLPPVDRIEVHKEEIVKQGKPHNALEDAKLTAECFSRLIYGKNLLAEFAKFPVPEKIKQGEEK